MIVNYSRKPLKEIMFNAGYDIAISIVDLAKTANVNINSTSTLTYRVRLDKLYKYLSDSLYTFEVVNGSQYYDNSTGIPDVKHYKSGRNSFYLSENLKLVIHVINDDDLQHRYRIYIHLDNSYNYDMYYTNKVNIFLKDIYSTLIDKNLNEIPKINIVTLTKAGYDLSEKELNIKPISIKDSYNDDLGEVYDTIIDRLNTPNDKGLILLHGIPGTGKTTFIRHLCCNIKDKKIIYIPAELAKSIADPGFLEFLIDNVNSVIVIEDAEDLIQVRNGSGRNSAVSNILNLSDGLLSDILNIQLICTFNCPISQIDKALLRKGRIIAKYEFKELSLDKTRKYLPEADKPMILADIFNTEDIAFIEERTLIGFK